MTIERAPRAARGLRGALPARVVLPGEERWDAARRAWNLAVDQRPAAVAPASADEVATLVRAARERGLWVAAQTTGHAAAAITELECTVLVKTSDLASVTEMGAPAPRPVGP